MDGAKYSDYMSSLQDEFQNNQIEFVMNRKFPKEATDMSMVRLYVYLSEHAQFLFDASTLTIVLNCHCILYRGGHVFWL